MWHPAALLVTWIGFAFFLQWLPWLWLCLLATLSLLLAYLHAGARCRKLLWRSRWLLASLGILFLFFTPGEYLPGFVGRTGVTYEGLEQAAIHTSLLLAMLASLALLHEHAGTQGLLAGIYSLLHPLAGSRRTVVRLMLVLEFVEKRELAGWREWLVTEGDEAQDVSISLQVPQLRLRDRFLIGVIGFSMLGWLAMP